MGIFDREMILIGKEGFNILQKSSVIVFGVGGVGGYVVEMLVRAGIGNITIVDFDNIDETNLNRQVIALNNNIGYSKVLEYEKRAKLINENININAINKKVEKSNIDTFQLLNYNFVVDAIDNVTNKVDLIEFCYYNNINIISAMGAGNKIGMPRYEIMDIFKTSEDGLAKITRKLLKDRGIKKLNVCCDTTTPVKVANRQRGSISYYPASCGVTISAYIINELLKETKDE